MAVFVFAFLLFCASALPAFAADKAKETAYERVMRTGTIRCGYGLWAPALMQDPNTGAMSGIFYDYVEELGKLLDLKIEWAVEVNLATYLQDMNAGKFDLECSGGWPNAYRGKFAEYTTPIFFTPVYLYTQAGNTAFDNNLEAANAPDVRFSVMDGEASQQIAQRRFPRAQEVAVPPSNPLSELADQILYKKADALVADPMSMAVYMGQHPGALHRVESDPVRLIPNNMTVPAGDFRFLNMLNIATNQMLYDGVIDRILQKYGVDESQALRVAKPYEGAQ